MADFMSQYQKSLLTRNEPVPWFSTGTGAAPSYNTSSADPAAGLRNQTAVHRGRFIRIRAPVLVSPPSSTKMVQPHNPTPNQYGRKGKRGKR